MKLTSTQYAKLINYSRPLVTSALLASSLFQLIPAVAAPAPIIINQATATYEDPSNPPNPNDPNDPRRINSTSNAIEVTIQEVAGIVVSQKALTDETGKNTIAKGGDTVYFQFELTNIGTDGTQVFVPNKATITGAGQVQKVQYFDEVAKAWKDVPDTGLTSGSIAPNEKLQLRVAVKIDDGASGKLAVSLGKTATPNTSNQERTAADQNPEDLYTVDNPDGTPGEIDGAPSNGARETMVTHEITIGAQPQAFATVKLATGAYVPADKSITYNLSFKVEDTVPSGVTNVVPADLVGSVIPGLGAKPGILVSDAIPLGTQFSSGTAPTGWIPVYQYGNPIGATDRADTSTWSTEPPNTTNSGTLVRVGFFLPDGRIPQGTSVTGFQVKVTVVDPAKTTQVANIAQLFGNAPANPTDPQDKTPNPNLPVADESGDNSPNNFNPNGTPGPKDPKDPTKPFVSPGVVDPSAPVGDPRNPTTLGQDPKGDNNGDGPGGEFTTTSVVVINLLNGPKDNPGAVGSTDNNSDFTNKSAPVTPGLKTGDKFDPDPVGFFNTVQNSSDIATDIKIIPTLKSDELLPEGTKITLKDPTKPTEPGVIFTVKGGKVVPNDPTQATLVLSMAAKGTADYINIVDLPAGTEAVKGYPIETIAFFDQNNDNLPGADEPSNKTLDRLYTGFIDLFKESRILDSSKQPLTDGRGVFSKENKAAKPGEYVEYRITFSNISPVTTDPSKQLSAANFAVIEDGNAAPNNWAKYTLNEPGSAKFNLGKLELTPVLDDINVTKYVNTVSILAPQQKGTFTFIRKVK